MKLFCRYLREKTRLLLLLGCCAAICGGLFALYRLPVSVALYAALLCLVAGLLLGLNDFLRFRRQHLRLQELSESRLLSMDELPEALHILEQDYQQLLAALLEEKRLLSAGYEREKSEIVDYYTLWAHQIKTPISALGLLLQQQDSEQSCELETQLLLISQYVEMVLAYLRLDSESSDYLLRRYELGPIVRQAARKFAPLFIGKRLSLDLGELQQRVLTDEKWLCFAIEQILSNAIKYTPSGSISIRCEEPASLIISDSGIGIAAEDLPRIFDKGFTGYNGRLDKRASGIGLYLTKRILDNLGHSISVSSQLDRGTTVTIDLSSQELLPN